MTDSTTCLWGAGSFLGSEVEALQADQSSTFTSGAFAEVLLVSRQERLKFLRETRAFLVATRRRRRLLFLLDSADRLLAGSGREDSRRFLPHSILTSCESFLRCG